MRCHATAAAVPLYLYLTRAVTRRPRQTWSTDPCKLDPRGPARKSSCALPLWGPAQTSAKGMHPSAEGGVKVIRDAYMQADERKLMESRVACKVSPLRPRSKKVKLTEGYQSDGSCPPESSASSAAMRASSALDQILFFGTRYPSPLGVDFDLPRAAGDVPSAYG